jgi:carbamoyl-phosphate synthase large subunit
MVGAVPRWRLETKAGISTKGKTFTRADVTDGVRQVLAAVGLEGAANVQGFVTDDEKVSFVEVNPRFSGGLPLSLAAGADLVGEYLRGVLGEPIRPDRLGFRPGVVMIRYFEEVFEG